MVPAAEPSPKFQLNEYGLVPPVAVAVKVTGLPTVGLAETVKVTVGGVPAPIWTDCVEVVVAALPSVTVNVTVFAPLVV